MSDLNHIAFIMDGNGRWGLKKKKSRNYGHLEGIKTVQKMVEASIYFKIPVIYSKGILDKKLEEFVLAVDLNNPKDLSEKIMKFDSFNNEINNKRHNAHNYFMMHCTDKKKREIIENALNEFNYTSKRWLEN